jgi:catechol 2,3-dioxygenase-like lactoylglutathione lyase family enzyme
MSMRFDHVGVLVADLEQAKAFARDVLGLGEPAAEFTAPEHGLAGAFFGLGEGRVEFFTLENSGETGRLPAGETSVVDHIAVKVDDLDAEQERLADGGVTFTGPATDDEIGAPIELRGSRHLWTKPETSGGFRLQVIGG